MKTLLVLQIEADASRCDDLFERMEKALPFGHARALELNQLRRNLAGFLGRLEKDFPPSQGHNQNDSEK